MKIKISYFDSLMRCNRFFEPDIEFESLESAEKFYIGFLQEMFRASYSVLDFEG